MSIIEIKTIQERYSAYFPKREYSISTRGYFKNKQDAENAIQYIESCIIMNSLK